MSFLNPVNEPVLRFSSTDVGAPQINYNARVAGDVKTVLKACLVTGYGDKASAGWSIANEVDHVAEFVSPSAAMSDYRLGIDDTSGSSTTWYYQYQDARVDPVSNSIAKNMVYYDKDSASNGWQLLTTNRGLFLVELFASIKASGLVARITYWGQSKSTAAVAASQNIIFWASGFGGGSTPDRVFDVTDTTRKDIKIDGYSAAGFISANMSMLKPTVVTAGFAVDMHAELYLHKNGFFIGQHPALILSTTKDQVLSGVKDTTFSNRPVLDLFIAPDSGSSGATRNSTINIKLQCDYWEY